MTPNPIDKRNPVECEFNETRPTGKPVTIEQELKRLQTLYADRLDDMYLTDTQVEILSKYLELAVNKIVMDIIGEKVPHSSTHNSDYPYTKGYGEACYCDLSPTNNRINKQLATAHQYGLGEK
jgi:hypothetical protein